MDEVTKTVMCPNCKRIVKEDEIIEVADDRNYTAFHDECEYCIWD
jgi:hypothetical protein